MKPTLETDLLRTYVPPAAALLVMLVGCHDGGSGRSASALAEVELTVQRGGSTDIRRVALDYESGGRLTDISFTVNGAAAGRMEATYSGDQLAGFEIVDSEGDRGELTLSYDDRGRLDSTELLASASYTLREQFTYDDARDGLPREVKATITPAGGSTDTSYRRFDYDQDRRLTSITSLQGDSTHLLELRYDGLDRLERATTLLDASVVDAHSYEYDDAGRIESVSNQNNERWDVRYDAEGHIEEIRHLVPSRGETVTTRYTYAARPVEGARFAPSLPNWSLFDLRGTPFATVEFLVFDPVSLDASMPSAPSGGNGGGGNDGGAATCTEYVADNSCEQCALDNCCAELIACDQSPECTTYYECLAACPDQDCFDNCGAVYPSGRYYFESYANCVQSACPVDCG